jgi:hypothetical protein
MMMYSGLAADQRLAHLADLTNIPNHVKEDAWSQTSVFHQRFIDDIPGRADVLVVIDHSVDMVPEYIDELMALPLPRSEPLRQSLIRPD